MIKFQLQCSSIFTGHRTISPESFPFLLEIFFVKECIKEITRFVAVVNNFRVSVKRGVGVGVGVIFFLFFFLFFFFLFFFFNITGHLWVK